MKMLTLTQRSVVLPFNGLCFYPDQIWILIGYLVFVYFDQRPLSRGDGELVFPLPQASCHEMFNPNLSHECSYSSLCSQPSTFYFET